MTVITDAEWELSMLADRDKPIGDALVKAEERMLAALGDAVMLAEPDQHAVEVLKRHITAVRLAGKEISQVLTGSPGDDS